MGVSQTHPPGFTAKQLAIKAGVSKITVLKHLADTAPSGSALVAGKLVRCWVLSALPVALRERIAAAANESHLTLDEYLASREPWRPMIDGHPVSLAEISPHCIERAVKLQRALLPALARSGDRHLSSADKEKLGCEEYKRVFGHSITERHFRRLLNRTIGRAGVDTDYSRLEIFLDERPARLVSQKSVDAHDEFPELGDRLAACAGNLSRDAEKLVWDEVFSCFDSQIADGSSPGAAKRKLLRFLHHHGAFLAASRNAMRVKFDYKYAAWQQSGGSIEGLNDRRARTKIQPSERLSGDEWKWLFATAASKGKVDLGWREFIGSDHARPETKALHAPNGRPPLTAPRWVRDEIGRATKNLQPYMRGPRTAEAAGAFIERDPLSIASGDVDQSDDKTLDLYWWEETPEGIWIGQGQLLPWIDLRSWLIYNLDLITDKAYSAFNIRNSWTNKVATWGLPRTRIEVERGIWKSARVFAGRQDGLGIDQMEMGVRRLGIKIRHCRQPQGKLIERVFGSLTDLLQGMPGYAGRNQTLERYEAVHKQLALCRRATNPAHPGEFFLHKAQVMDRLEEFARKLNTTPKRGKYHNGLTPEECYEKHFNREDRVRWIPDELRRYFASNCIEDVPVGRNGVSFQFGRGRYNYRNHIELARLKGARVTVWFSPEDPSVCSITHPSLKESIVVEREPLVSHDATPGEMARAKASIATFESYSKEMFRTLKPMFSAEFKRQMFRTPIVDQQSLDECRSITEQTAAIKTRQKEENRLERRARVASDRLGMHVTPGMSQRAGVVEARERLASMLAEDDEPEAVP